MVESDPLMPEYPRQSAHSAYGAGCMLHSTPPLIPETEKGGNGCLSTRLTHCPHSRGQQTSPLASKHFLDPRSPRGTTHPPPKMDLLQMGREYRQWIALGARSTNTL